MKTPKTSPKATTAVPEALTKVESSAKILTAPLKPAAEAPSPLFDFDRLPDAAYVRLPVLAALKGISPATCWRWVKAGRLPAPVKLGPNTTAWKVGDLRRAEVSQ